MPDGTHDRVVRTRRNTWGIPETDPDIPLIPLVEDILDDWIYSSSMMLVSAPSGYGKTTQIAQWLRGRPTAESVIWISGSLLIQGWSEVSRVACDALVDLGLIDEITRSKITGLDNIYVELQRLERVLIVVLHDADRLMPMIDVNALEREFSRFPMVRPVVMTTTVLEGDHLLGDPGRRRIERWDLAWNADYVRKIARENPFATSEGMSVEELSESAGGRASAIISYLEHSSRDASVLARSDFTARWIHDRATLAGADALDLLFVLSQFLVVPRDYLPTIAIGELHSSLEELERDGLIEPVTLPGETQAGAFTVSAEVRESISSEAQKSLADRLPGLHAAAAEYFLLRGHKALALYHLAHAGEHERALDLLKEPVSGHDATVGLELLRAATDALPPAVLRADAEALAIRLLLRRLPPTESGDSLLEGALTLVNLPSAVIDAMPERATMVVATAIIAMGTGWGITGTASAIAKRIAESALGRSWEGMNGLGGVPAVLWTTQAEAEMLSGNIGRAFEFADAATRWADNRSNVFEHYLAGAVTASLAAIEGDHARARSLIARSQLNYGLGNWAGSTSLNAMAFARILIASADADGLALGAVARDLRETNDPGSAWHAVAVMAEAHRLLLTGRQLEAMARVRAMLRDIGSLNMPTLLRGYTASITASILHALGRPAAAIAALAEAPETQEHSFCVGSDRAIGALALGDARGALKYTDGCIALGDGHATRTLVHVLLRRAVAHEMLDVRAAADAEFLEAVNLLLVSPSTVVFYHLRVDTLELLWSRLGEERPALHAATSNLMDPWRRLAAAVHTTPVPTALSRQELTVLQLLRTDGTSRQIGEALFISENTVKTHVRRIYRKLGVSTRSEALGAADHLGLLGPKPSAVAGRSNLARKAAR